jgi:hypothetical protein
MKKLILLLSGLTIGAMPVTKFPQTDISNGIITAKIYLPDAEKGYYQGTRFDWAGNMPELQFKGHEFFGQWFSKYDPKVHESVMGPVEEFMPLDYPETKSGESFLKIGVGVLEKPDNEPYAFARYYNILNPGKWTVVKKSDQVHFTHELNDKNYSYKYNKTVQLVKGKPELVLSHTLKNTGSRTIETSAYDHNFFVIDKQPVGPGYEIIFPYDISGEGSGFGELIKASGKKLIFTRNLVSGETVFSSGLEGFSGNENNYDIRIENKIAGAGVRITCDQPLLKLVFWSCATTTCPEPYIKIKVEPGKEISWKITYNFYTLDKK